MFASNFKLKKIKKYIYSAITFFCFLILCVCGFSLFLSTTIAPQNQNVLHAQALNEIPYFKAKVGSTQYYTGDSEQTIFLNSGQKLEINFGKPTGSPYDDEEANNIYIRQSDIGEYALSFISGHFSLKINGIEITDVRLQEKFSVESYYYNPNYAPGSGLNEGRDFAYFVLSINLSDTDLFSSGKYEISFNNYMEYSSEDFDSGIEKNFTATFYLFNTTEYFSSESAINTKTNMNNVRSVAKVDAIYKNYFYYNYANQGITSSFNALPYLSFEMDKFILEISKSYQGVTQSCVVSKFEQSYVKLGQGTSNDFLNVINNENKLEIYFNDLGEYIINYKFIYSTSSSYVFLKNNKIDSFKKDILHIYGYQLSYFDINSQKISEFKHIEDGKYNQSTSADVSFLLPYGNLTNNDVSELSDDTAILQEIYGKKAVSTNQPFVSVQYNAKLNNANSYYYVWDKTISDWEKENDSYIKNPFTNTSFADANTYLLKVIYNYDHFYNISGNLAPNVYFVQYFYFTITNVTATISILEQVVEAETNEITEIPLSTDSYTQNSVKISLSGQSIFNSNVSVDINSKNYTYTNYVNEKTLYSSTQEQFYVVSENKNYKITMHFGTNKTQTSFFTIDNNPFENVKVVQVTKSVGSSNHFVKGESISFFTNQSVAVEWDKKQSGAGSRAYYKYIPFKNVGHISPNSNYFNNDRALPTNYALDLDINNEYSSVTYSNSKYKSLLEKSYVFSEQGFYIVRLSDEAGNWQYISFCIDKTEMTIWQFSGGSYQDVQKYNVVSANTQIQWGNYKLIDLNLKTNQLNDINDQWIKDIIKEKFENTNDNDIFKSNFYSDELFFAVKIHSIKYLQEGSTYVKLTNGEISKEIKLVETIDGTELAIEMTYVFYFIDESNPHFNHADTLSASDFANFASKNFRITTSSDASKADVLFNSSNSSSADFSNLNFNSSNLSQSGFTDSYSYNYEYENFSDKLDIRSKYYYATGTTSTGNVSLLSYIFIANPSDLITVEKVTVYYYAYITIGKQFKLSDTAIEINVQIDNTTLIENGDFSGFQAYNINPEYDSATNSYRTKEGKYVVVRSYSQSSSGSVDKYDFLNRESVFMVDRQNIVSSPVFVGDDYVSIVGQFIHLFVLDGETNRVKFDDVYMAYNTDGFILETNKLPVISYTPISKYGDGTDNSFNFYEILQYFYTMTSDQENYYLKRFETENQDEKSILGISYFGSGTLTKSGFGQSNNLSNIKNSSFDLTVKIDYSVEEFGERTVVFNGTTDANGYFTSTDFKNEGYYFVTIVQNYANGSIFPNVRNSFSFNFYISKIKPQFSFLNSDEEELKYESSDINTFYTNENSVRVSWTDDSSPYIAKINMKDSGNGYTNGIYYYTNLNSTPRYIKVNDIVTDGLNHYFDLNLSSYVDSTILHVYMEYEGRIKNDSSSVKKALYIDRQAPLQVLNTLIASTLVNEISVGGYSRIYVDDTNEQTQTDRRYNIPTSTGALAFYTFAVEHSEQNFNTLFKSQPAINGFYTEGYYYNALEIGNSSSLSVTNITSAKSAFASHTVNLIAPNIVVGKIYEVIETDLAGNITIYLIYFVKPNNNEVVLEFEKPATDLDDSTNLRYGELTQSQNIFAKNYFKLNKINLYNYEWLIFNLNGITYLSTPHIENNCFYNITNWSDLNASPTIVSLENLVSFSNSRNLQILTLVEPCKNFNYVFKISVTNEKLTYASLQGQTEGITITAVSYQNGISVYLSSISIYSWENSTYSLIYNADIQSSFLSTNNITIYTPDINNKSFIINQPNIAYKYVFSDNYGVSYVFYHTIGEPEIEEKIVGATCNILLPDDDGIGTTHWYVGFGNINYYYSNVDYYIYIKLEYLSYNKTTSTFSWTTFNAGGEMSQYGSRIISGMSTIYYNCTTSTEQNSINQIKLLAQSSTMNLNGFEGTALKYVITLVNAKENQAEALEPENVIQEHVLINNLNPTVRLFDKNNQNKDGLFDAFSLFSGQLTIRYNNLNYNNPAIFQTKVTMQHEDEVEIDINSGTNVDMAGSYRIRTYIIVGNNSYLYKTQSFVISESSTDFYKVMVYDSKTGNWEIKNSTGKTFECNGTYYSSHYIVNTENYIISINEEQDIVSTKEPYDNIVNGTHTKFYKITNYGSLSKSINYYQKIIAITYIQTESLLTTNSFYYTSADGENENLTGISSQIIITTANQDFENLSIVYSSYYGIKENKIDVFVYFGENELEYIPLKSTLSNSLNIITLTESGNYTIYFKDQAGNVHKFIDEENISLSYQIVYINGVMFLVNENQPIENGVYNDEVIITLPPHMNSYYDAGGKPEITVIKNGEDYTNNVTKNANGEYLLNSPGFYRVYFSAKIEGYNIRNQSYSFTIIDSTEARWVFEFSEFANYEIISVKKNGNEIDLSKYYKYNTYTIIENGTVSTVKYLRNIYISLFDEVTGAGDYEITIRTNIGISGQAFTFNFMIKNTNIVPIKISIPEGTSTSDVILVSFNAYDLYNKLGKCYIFLDSDNSMQMSGQNSILIDRNYIENLTDYNVVMEINKTGTAFVQVHTPSGKVLYSYKIIKDEPLNATSIIIIVSSILVVVSLIITITLLRRRMKIR